MKQLSLFPARNNGLVMVNNDQVVTTSLIVAEYFGKRHSDVLRAIKNLECSCAFHQRNFASMVEMKKLPQGGATKTEFYYLTRDGFTLLAMGFTGKIAAQFKEVYINAFNAMEKKLRSQEFRKESKELKQLRSELEFTQARLKYKIAESDQESELKNSCFYFLVGKGLYTEYHEWLRKQITKEVTATLQKSINY